MLNIWKVLKKSILIHLILCCRKEIGKCLLFYGNLINQEQYNRKSLRECALRLYKFFGIALLKINCK